MTKRKPGDYEIGYGKPPKSRQFKPGQSGNPRGRPTKRPSLAELFMRELRRTRVIVEDGQRLLVRTDEVLVKQVVNLGLKGDKQIMKLLMPVIEHIRETENLVRDPDPDMPIEEAIAEFKRLRQSWDLEADISSRMKKSFKL